MKKEAMLYEKSGERVHCFLCAHHCKISNGKFGFCGVRENIDGKLYTYVYGDVMARQVDPVEKKPLYHFLPGTQTYSIATPGCNFHCDFCQNWQISQRSFRDGTAGRGIPMTPRTIVEAAKEAGCKSISYTYTEPTIFFEYAYDIAVLAHEAGLRNVFVSNGFMTSQAIEKISSYLDAINIDVKAFTDSFYHDQCAARLQPVLDSIKLIKEKGIWLEVTTLLIPGRNDSTEELNAIASFIAKTGKGIPWHISRFHPDYQYTDAPVTPSESLHKAREIGKKHGLEYVYLGNIAEDTSSFCPRCDSRVIDRSRAYGARSLLQEGHCPSCGFLINGVWE
ncbi:MAG: AmmeMemoRadiSam system radical SAM enzyme [Chitinivibrionales bacterium]